MGDWKIMPGEASPGPSNSATVAACCARYGSRSEPSGIATPDTDGRSRATSPGRRNIRRGLRCNTKRETPASAAALPAPLKDPRLRGSARRVLCAADTHLHRAPLPRGINLMAAGSGDASATAKCSIRGCPGAGAMTAQPPGNVRGVRYWPAGAPTTWPWLVSKYRWASRSRMRAM